MAARSRDYREGDLGRWRPIVEAAMDTKAVKLGRWMHYAATRVRVETDLLGDVVLDLYVTSKGWRCEVVQLVPGGGEGVSTAYLERLTREWPGLERVAVRQAQHDAAWLEGWEYPQTDEDNLDMWRALLVKRHPKQTGETNRAWYLRLWEDVYLPHGASIYDLAGDLGLDRRGLDVSLSRARRDREGK
jgi:hypothetical protein